MTTAAAADDAGDSFPQNLSSAEHLDGGRPPGRGAAEVKMQHLMLIFPPKNWHCEVHCTAFTWFSPLPRAHFVHKVYFHKTQPRPSSLSHRSYKMWSIVNVTFIRFCCNYEHGYLVFLLDARVQKKMTWMTALPQWHRTVVDVVVVASLRHPRGPDWDWGVTAPCLLSPTRTRSEECKHLFTFAGYRQ